jgi:hypothetical protein
MFLTFDGPSGETCLPRRDVSNSPLQALTLLNDVIFLEAAQAIGRLAMSQAESDESRAALIFRRCVTRPPDSDEIGRLVEFARRQRDRFSRAEAEAAKLAGAGARDVVESATWTATARAVLNLDEAVVKR